MLMVLRTDYIKFIFIQLQAVVLCVFVCVWERGVFMSFGRKFWAGRKLKNLLTLFVSLTQTENRKLDLKTAKGDINKTVFSIKMSSRALKPDKPWQQSGFFVS